MQMFWGREEGGGERGAGGRDGEDFGEREIGPSVVGSLETGDLSSVRAAGGS